MDHVPEVRKMVREATAAKYSVVQDRFPNTTPAGYFPQFSAGYGLISLLGAAALSACATKPPAIPSVQVQRVEVPVPVKCVNEADIPAEPGEVMLTGDARKDDALLAAKLAAIRVWGRSLVGMLGPCAR